MVARKKTKRTNRSRSSGRRPANQQRNTAGSRDGIPGSQQARRGGKANQAVNKVPENPPNTQNGSAPPAPPAPAPEAQPSGPNFNVDEVKKLLESGMDPSAEVYKAPKSPTKAGPPANPWAPKRESTFYANATLAADMMSSWADGKRQGLFPGATQAGDREASRPRARREA